LTTTVSFLVITCGVGVAAGAQAPTTSAKSDTTTTKVDTFRFISVSS
jgi:hypothetical protein